MPEPQQQAPATTPPVAAAKPTRGKVRGQGHNPAGQCYEWADTTLCMVVTRDKATPVVIGMGRGTIVTLDEAVRYVTATARVPYQYIIVRLDAIAPFRLESSDKRQAAPDGGET